MLDSFIQALMGLCSDVVASFAKSVRQSRVQHHFKAASFSGGLLWHSCGAEQDMELDPQKRTAAVNQQAIANPRNSRHTSF